MVRNEYIGNSDLPLVSQNHIGQMPGTSPRKCFNVFTPYDLAASTVEILGKLEQSRSGYDLLSPIGSLRARSLGC